MKTRHKLPYFISVLLLGFAIPCNAMKEGTMVKSDQLELVSEEELNHFYFKGNVHVEGDDLDVVCNTLHVISGKEGDKAVGMDVGSIKKIEAHGDVRIKSQGKEATSGYAEIIPEEQKLVLFDNPEVVDEQGIVRGHRITMYHNDKRAIVEGNPESGDRPAVLLPVMANMSSSPAEPNS